MLIEFQNYRNKLHPLIEAAIQSGDSTQLESCLVNLARAGNVSLNDMLFKAFAQEIGAMVILPDPPVARLEALLDGWARYQEGKSRQREILALAALAAYSRVAVVRPDWRADELAKLQKATADPRLRVREMASALLAALVLPAE